MPQELRLPASILPTGTYYTTRVAVGAGPVVLDVILDTGSSVFAVDGAVFDPIAQGCGTTRLVQNACYIAASFMCAVVQGAVSFGDGAPVQIAQANIGVAYGGAGAFGRAGGIWGLAYEDLDGAVRMLVDTWQAKYDASQLGLGTKCDISPLFDQIAAAGLIGQQFAFRINRAMPRLALADPAADPLNTAVFVVGGGMDCVDLYNGNFSRLAVMDQNAYNVTLLAVRVGGQPAITVPAPWGRAISSASIDSGSPNLVLDQALYETVMDAFSAIDPAYGAALLRQDPAGEDPATLNLAAWPDLVLSFQADGGGTADVRIGPTAYWQLDATAGGRAVAMLAGDCHKMGGCSLVGLPFFVGNYVVFDRSAPIGRGVVAVAPGA